MNPYEVLDIAPGATADEIKAAYHSMAKQWHPDRFNGDAKPEAERRFRMLAEAFNMLKDTGRRDVPEAASAPRPEARTPAPAPASAGQTPSMAIQLDSNVKTSVTKTVDDWFNEAKAAFEAKSYERCLGLIQYAIRLDGERGEFHAMYGKVLEQTGGDKRLLVRTLETALRLNPKDVDTTILLAQTFQNLGMHARASRLWSVVHNLAPGHPVFTTGGKAAEAKAGKGGKAGKEKAASENPTMAEQWHALVEDLKDKVSKLLNRG